MSLTSSLSAHRFIEINVIAVEFRTLTYDNQYLHSFSYYSSAIGSSSDYIVPDQFSHNLSLSYSIRNGRYNFSFECRNLTDEKLYDNFSLQKAGRAFYGKVRVYFGN